VLFSGVQIGEGAVVKNSVIMPNAVIGTNTKVYSAIIGSDVNIEDDCEIGEDGVAGITVIGESMLIPRSTKLTGIEGDYGRVRH
jgi:glucose-1-phosphate adenylyltransferase